MPPSNIEDIYRQQGWNDGAAIKADIAAGGWQSKVPQSSSSSSSSALNIGNFNPLDAAKQIQSFNVEANKPVVAALEASKQPLKDRYDSILASLKGSRDSQVNRQTIATRNELAGRGIYGGGFADQEMTNAINPIEGDYQNKVLQAGAAQGSDMSNLAIQIAQAQAGNPSNAVSTALSLGQLQSQLAQQSLENNKLTTEVVTVGGRKKLINKQTGAVIQDLGADTTSTTTGTSTSDLAVLQQILNGGTTKTTTNTTVAPTSSFKPLSTSTTYGGNYSSGMA